VKDKGKGAENLIWLASRQSGRADPSLLAADDILAALTGRIAELEARVSEILAEVDPELPPVDSKQGGARSAPKPDVSRATDKIHDARVEADAELTRASEERRMLANEMRLLREAFQEARRSQLPAAPRANAAEAQIVPDLRTAIADEMRSLLTELFADFRSRAVAAPPPVEHVQAETEPTVEVVAAAPAVVDVVATEPPAIVEHVDELVIPTTGPRINEYAEGLQTAPPLIDSLAAEAAPIETIESIVEHVDELVRPITKPIVHEYAEELRKPEPIAPADVFPVEAAPAEPPAPIVNQYLEEFLRTESPPTIDAVHLEVAPLEPARPVVDEHVFWPAEPTAPIVDEYVEELRRPGALRPIETFELNAAPSEPIVNEYIEELRRPEAPPPIESFELGAIPSEPIVDAYLEDLRLPEAPPPLETFDVSAVPAEQTEPIVQEHVDELPRNEFAEPIIDEYFAPPTDLTISPSAPPPAPDPRLAALWDAAPLPTEAEMAPIAEPDPISLITEDFIAHTRQVEIPETQYPPQEFPPEQTIEYAPPQEFPLPPAEFAPEPPAIVEPEQEASMQPLITESEPAASFSSLFPELRVADERGLHQIQVVISPVHSFPRLLETERRIRALSTVVALHLRDFRNGVATLTVAVSEAISPAEFGAVIQMLESLHLRLEGTTQSSVELRAEDEPPSE
jgi:hypothetical protein